MKALDVLVECVPGTERRQIPRVPPGDPPPVWRVSRSGRVALGLASFQEAVAIAQDWVAHTSLRIYHRGQPYGPPQLYEPTK